MNKKHARFMIFLAIVAFIILVSIRLLSKDIKIADENLSSINIIDSDRNIRTVSITDLQDANIKEFKLEDIIDEKYDKAVIMGQLGEIQYLEGGKFKVKSQRIDYIGKGKKIKGVKGVMINPPNKSIMDSYHDMAQSLEEEKVLCFLLDGFGYHQYIYAIENGYLPFLSQQAKAEKATSVYRPVTNAGLTAMITGEPPTISGVYSRAQRELKVGTIFQLAQEINKKAIYIEGDIGIVKTEIEAVLNLDTNGDGFTDDEVFASTLEAMKEDYDLIFTHFHGIDDCGHSYGDLAPETLEFITKVDAYLEELVLQWDGKIIITADHGMHTTEYGGDHGEFRYENMIVPYIILDGGNRFE